MNKNRRLNLKTPNWSLFSDIIEVEIIKIQHNDQSNIENTVKILTDIITSAAEISIGSCINHNKNPKVPNRMMRSKELYSIKRTP